MGGEQGLDLSGPGQIPSISPTSVTVSVFNARTFIFLIRTANTPFLFPAIPQHTCTSSVSSVALDMQRFLIFQQPYSCYYLRTRSFSGKYLNKLLFLWCPVIENS